MFPSWHFWLCLILFSGSALASDVPFIFYEDTVLANYSSAQIKEASYSSKDLVGVPSVISPPDKEVLKIPVTGGGGTSEGTIEREAGDLKDELNRKVETDNNSILVDAKTQASKHPGDLGIDQICEIYYYLKYGGDKKSGWKYVRDTRGIDSWNYANNSFAIGETNNCVGIGDCDDFAILMAAYVESIGGATRIILANNNSTGGHAYTEVYLGKLENHNDRVVDIIKWLQQASGSDKIYCHIDTDNKEIWLNLDWGPDKNGNAHPGGPLFHGDKHYVLRIRDKYKMVPLSMPEAANRSPRLISMIPDKSSPQEVGSVVTWTAKAKDPDNDQILYRYLVGDYQVANWRNNNSLVWTSTEADIGDNQIEVQIRDGKHAGPNRFDDNEVAIFTIGEAEPQQFGKDNYAPSNCTGNYSGFYHSLYIADINFPCPNLYEYAEYDLYGDGGDFDLYVLDSWNNTWYSSETTGYNEYLKVPIHCGYDHEAYVWTYNGSGSWNVCSPQITFGEGFRRINDSETAPDEGEETTTTTATESTNSELAELLTAVESALQVSENQLPSNDSLDNYAPSHCTGSYSGFYNSLYLAGINFPCPNSYQYAEYDLYGDGGDFDLYVLDSWNNTWYSSETTGYNEYLKVPIHCGYDHEAYVWTYNGSGSWSVCSPQITWDAGFERIVDSDTAPDAAANDTAATTSSESTSSELVGRWILTYDWDCDGTSSEGEIIFRMDGTFGEEDLTRGRWSMYGQLVFWEHDDDTNAQYMGSLEGLYMSGIMFNNDGSTGCWNARKES